MKSNRSIASAAAPIRSKVDSGPATGFKGPSFEAVKKKAKGHWHSILTQYGVNPRLLKDEHSPCPGCGGRDRFRFDDKDGDGTWFCSQGGGGDLAGDGFLLLVHCGIAKDAHEALMMIADKLGVKGGDVGEDRKEVGRVDYFYETLDGKKRLKVTRIEFDDGSKTFRQYGKGGQTPKQIEGFEYVPYRVAKWAENMPPEVFIVEGEKCVDAMIEQLGLPATCNAGGAGKFQPELVEYFRDVCVTIIPDNDPAGMKHAHQVAKMLTGVVASIDVLDFDGMGYKYDVADWIKDNDADKEKFLRFRKRAESYTDWARIHPEDDAEPPTENRYEWQTPPKEYTLIQWGKLPESETPYLIDGILPAEGFSVVFGEPGTFKSFLLMHMATCIAHGTSFLGKDAKLTGAVVYLALEGRSGLKKRCDAATIHHDLPKDLPIYFITDGVDLRGVGDAVILIECIRKADVKPVMIVVDTLQRAFGGGNENTSEDMGAFIANCDLLQRLFNASVVVVHHSGKDADRGPRGFSGLHGAADAELLIKRTDKESKVATLYVQKQKDAEDGYALHFKAVDVELPPPEGAGRQIDTGEKITSLAIEEATPDEARAGRKNLPRLTGATSDAWAALNEVIQRYGKTSAGSDIEPPRGAVFVEYALWKQTYETRNPIDQDQDQDDLTKDRERRKQSFKNARRALRERHLLIEERGNFVWLNQRNGDSSSNDGEIDDAA